jgi:hypothetical protein
MSSPQTPEFIVSFVTQSLRELIHDMNNSIFIARGFIEEIGEEIRSKEYKNETFDDENFSDMISTVERNIHKIDAHLAKLRKFTKEDIFEQSGVDKDLVEIK